MSDEQLIGYFRYVLRRKRLCDMLTSALDFYSPSGVQEVALVESSECTLTTAIVAGHATMGTQGHAVRQRWGVQGVTHGDVHV